MAATKASTRRQQRQEAIRGIVRAEGVKTQRDLADKLHEAGFKCTQAHFPGALGTVAGDDTIMIAAESFEAADRVARMVERLRRR